MERLTLDAVVSAGDIELGRGDVISTSDLANFPGNYPVYSSSAKGNGEFGRYGRFMFDEPLITWSVDGGGRFFFRSRHKYSVTNVCGYMRVKGGNWDQQYVYYSLDHQHGQLSFDYQSKAHPSVIRHIYSLNLIPRLEQSQIAEVLSTVDRAIAQTEALIAKQQRIKTGLMQDLLTRGIDEAGNLRSEATHTFKDSPLGRIPAEWDVKRVGQVFHIQLGKMLSKLSTTGRSPYPYLGNKNVQWDYVDTTDIQFMDFNENERKRFSLRYGDVLVCEGGEVGRTCLWRSEIDSCFYQKAIHRLRPKGEYLPELFPQIMQWNVRQGLLANFTSQTSIAHLTKEKLSDVPIAVPTVAEQKDICRLLDDMDRSIRTYSEKKLKLLHIKTGLMQGLLTGKVRVTPLLEQEKATA